MTPEKHISGKVDANHHEGMRSTMRREAEADDAALNWFIDQFGVPLSWAMQMAQMDSDVGRRWKHILDTLNNPDQPSLDS